MSVMMEEDYLLRDNVEKTGDGQYKVTCPYDGEEFVNESLETALRMEGVYRSENHIDATENIARQNEMKHTRRNIIEDKWKGENRA